jgi:hypothetical protein
MYYFSAKVNQCMFWMKEQRRERPLPSLKSIHGVQLSELIRALSKK